MLVGLPAVGQGPASVAEQYLFAAANAERVQRGLQPLHWDAALYRAAGSHAREMAARGSISHQYAGEPELAERGRAAGARFSVIAENVAESPTSVQIHDAWMNSAGHRANLLDPTVDSVGIRVLSRNGELYAVEDFSRSVQRLALPEQELAVETLLERSAAISLLTPTADSRRTCAMDTGYAGERRPGFVMRYTAADLSSLPEALKNKLATGQFHQAQVGACETREQEPFSTFHIAVLLYP